MTNILASWLYRNPVFHQVVFATIMLTITARGAYLLRVSPTSALLERETKSKIARLYQRGAGMFLLGFLIWNIDNLFCDTLSGWKLAVKWPAAFLLEGNCSLDAVDYYSECSDIL